MEFPENRDRAKCVYIIMMVRVSIMTTAAARTASVAVVWALVFCFATTLGKLFNC